MASATKIVGAIAGGAWTLLFAMMMLMNVQPVPSAGLGSVAFISVPALVAVAAFWIAFRSEFGATKRALIIQILFLAVAAFCCVIVAAASGG